jgi:hypothetical protein
MEELLAANLLREGEFDLVLIPFNTFEQIIGLSARIKVLSLVKKVLRKGGVLYLNTNLLDKALFSKKYTYTELQCFNLNEDIVVKVFFEAKRN